MSQANAAPITGDCTIVGAFSASLPDMSAGNIADASPSRRSMLAGLLAATVGGSALVAGAAIGAPPKGEATMNMHTTMLSPVRPSKWKEELARYRAIDAAWDEFLEAVYNPAVQEVERRAPLPPKSFTITAESGRQMVYMHDRANPDVWANSPLQHISTPGRVLAEQWRQWEIDHERLNAEVGMAEIDAKDDQFSKELFAQRDRLMATPVKDAAELLEKMEIAWAEGCDPEPFKHEIFRDLHRLAA